MKHRRSVLCVAVLLVLAGCSRPDQAAGTADAGGAPVDGDWAIVQYQAEPDGLNPLTSSNAYSTYVEYGINFSNVFETLLQYDRDNKWAFTKPLLAETYPEVSPDHLTYTFTLKDGVKWHDGQPLTP